MSVVIFESRGEWAPSRAIAGAELDEEVHAFRVPADQAMNLTAEGFPKPLGRRVSPGLGGLYEEVSDGHA